MNKRIFSLNLLNVGEKSIEMISLIGGNSRIEYEILFDFFWLTSVTIKFASKIRNTIRNQFYYSHIVEINLSKWPKAQSVFSNLRQTNRWTIIELYFNRTHGTYWIYDNFWKWNRLSAGSCINVWACLIFAFNWRKHEHCVVCKHSLYM